MTFTEFWNFVLITYQDESVLTVGRLVIAFGVLLVGLFISGWVTRLLARRLKRTSLTADTLVVMQKMLFFLLVIVTVFMALGMLRVPLTAFTFMSGALALAVGFGAQAVINNFISGWILMSERPVRIGDFIEIEGSRGMVERIGNRSTQIRRIDGVHIMVPNSLLMERTLVNWTLIDRNIRTSVLVGVAYGSPVRQVAALIRQAIEENPDVLREPAPLVVFDDFGDSALVFESLFWCRIQSGEKELRQVRSELRFRIDELFRENGITIAFPQRDLHLKTASPIEVKVSEHDR